MELKDFKKVSLEEATKIPDDGGNYRLVKNKWWVITDDNCILYYKGTFRQCNSDKSVAEYITKKHCPSFKVKFLENVWEVCE